MSIPGWILILLLVLTGFLLVGPSTGDDVISVPPVVKTVTTEVEVNGNPGVVLHADAYWGDVPNWTPTDEEFQAAEDAVTVAAPLDGRGPVLHGFRQYIGFIEDGEHKIVINSACIELEGWREHLVGVDDGGPCFWEATYNVDTGELEHLVVNGQA